MIVDAYLSSERRCPWGVGEVVVFLAYLAVRPVAVTLAVHALPAAAGFLIQLLVEPAAVRPSVAFAC